MPGFCPLCRHVGGSSIHVDVLEIHNSFKNGQMIGRHIQGIMAQHKREAMGIAPYRTGRLMREHFATITQVKAGPQRAYTVGTHVNYAIFLFGTANNGAGLIRAKGKGMLELRPVPYSWFRVDDEGRIRKSVHGQKPHKDRNWLKRSLLRTLALRKVLTISEAVAMSKDLETKG